MTAVVVEEARREFDGRNVLDGVDLTIEPGEFVALLGAGGSGRSTLLRALAGLDRGATGDFDVPDRRAVVFQDVEEALLLADRALLLRDGRIAEEFVVDVPRPRVIDHPRLLTLRRALLAGLGVTTESENDR